MSFTHLSSILAREWDSDNEHRRGYSWKSWTKNIIGLCNLYLTDYYIILFQTLMTLFVQKLLKMQDNKDNDHEFMKLNLIIDWNNQNQTIDFKLNIYRNNLRQLFHQSTFLKMTK